MDTEDKIKRVLEEYFGLHVEKIPESSNKTPDFLVKDGKYEYLIEVKEKEDDPKVRNAREDAFTADEFFKISESLATKAVLQNVVRGGRKQIDSFVTSDSTLRVVWVHCTGLTYEATFEQIVSGLYGSEFVVDISADDAHCRTCYYFGFSQFFKYKDSVDAVMVSGRDGMVSLCINNHSPRYEQLLESGLVRSMPTGVRDPVSEEECGGAFIVDGIVDRKKSGEVLSYLQSKYNIEKLAVMNMRYMEIQKSFLDMETNETQ